MSSRHHLRLLQRFVLVALASMCMAVHAASDCDSVTVEYDSNYPRIPPVSRESTKLVVERCHASTREKDAIVDEYFRAVQSVLIARQIPKYWGKLPFHFPTVRVTVVNGGQRFSMAAAVNEERQIFGPGGAPKDLARYEGMKEIVALTQQYLAARYRFAP